MVHVQSFYVIKSKATKTWIPPPNSQQRLPLSVFESIYNSATSSLDIAISQLILGALFFAIRSCEYSHVPNDKDRKTKTLCLHNIKFFHGLSEITDINNTHTADFVQITFEFQKSSKKHQSVIQHKTNKKLCPVKVWSDIKKLILSYHSTSENSKVNLFRKGTKLVEITSKQIRDKLKSTVKQIDPLKNFYTMSHIGTHTICTRTAMILHFARVDTYIIKMIGRWASKAFMKYIFSYLPSFSKDLSSIIINSTDQFYNIPTLSPNTTTQNSFIPSLSNTSYSQHYTVFRLWS